MYTGGAGSGSVGGGSGVGCTTDVVGSSSSFFHLLFVCDKHGSDVVLYSLSGETGDKGLLREPSPGDAVDIDGCESDVAGTNVGAICLDQDPTERDILGLCVSVTLTGVGRVLDGSGALGDVTGTCSNVVLLLVGVGETGTAGGEPACAKLGSSNVTPFTLLTVDGADARGIGMDILNIGALGGGGGGV